MTENSIRLHWAAIRELQRRVEDLERVTGYGDEIQALREELGAMDAAIQNLVATIGVTAEVEGDEIELPKRRGRPKKNH